MTGSRIGLGFVRHNGYRYVYGVVVDCAEDHVEYCEVKSIYNDFGTYTPCYNDSNASDRHMHNVRLVDCPPPFVDLCHRGDNPMKSGVYVIADLSELNSMSIDEFDKYAEIIDDCKKVSDRDLDDIKNHLKDDSLELEKMRNSQSSGVDLDIVFDDVVVDRSLLD